MNEEARDMTSALGIGGERQRLWLLIVGGALIVVMLLIAVFSLGVYVGEHGWTRQGLTLQGPSPQPGPAQQPQAGPGLPPPLPGGGRPSDLVGRIWRALDGTLFLVTSDGPRMVEVDRATEVETHEGDPHSLDDLRPGWSVAVFGYRSRDGQTLVAELIVLLPAAGRPPADP
jgi:hypothetical protein